ncbi:MAG: NYN domain-containing protein [Verrucomicrobiota bacterium]|nr:NYN domain-containing protein [Verrucomicrobiota bacterium]
MGLLRILVDGYSLLHAWPELAPGKARFSAAARDELIHWLTQYRDATGTPITVIFDGAGAPAGISKMHSTPEMEILFSKAGHTADDLIERAAHRFAEHGPILVVTNDFAERDTVFAGGAHFSSCQNFIREIQITLGELHDDLKNYNKREMSRFKKPK